MIRQKYNFDNNTSGKNKVNITSELLHRLHSTVLQAPNNAKHKNESTLPVTYLFVTRTQNFWWWFIKLLGYLQWNQYNS